MFSVRGAKEVLRMPAYEAARRAARQVKDVYLRAKPYIVPVLTLAAGALVGMSVGMVDADGGSPSSGEVKFGSLTLTEQDADKILIVRITNPVGLHAQPTARMVRSIINFKARIMLHTSFLRDFSLSSIISVLSLGVPPDAIIVLTFIGDDATEARLALKTAIEDANKEKPADGFDQSKDKGKSNVVIGKVLTFEEFRRAVASASVT